MQPRTLVCYLMAYVSLVFCVIATLSIQFQLVYAQATDSFSTDVSGYALYTGYNFSLQYPESWSALPYEVDMPIGTESVILGNINEQTAVMILSAPYPESTENMTQEFIDSNLETILPTDFPGQFISGFEHGRVTELKKPVFDRYTIDGHRTATVDLSTTNQNLGTNSKNLLVVTIAGGNIFLLYYSAPENTYNQSLPVTENIIKTIKFSNNLEPNKINGSEPDNSQIELDAELNGTSFSLNHPSTWRVQNMTAPDGEAYSIFGDTPEKGYMIFGLGPLTQKDIDAFGLPDNTTQDEIDANLDRIFPLLIKQIQSGFHQGDPSSPDEVLLDKYVIDGHKVGAAFFDIEYQNLTLRAVAIGTVIGNEALALGYISMPETFNDNLPIIENMIKSIKLKPKVPDLPISLFDFSLFDQNKSSLDTQTQTGKETVNENENKSIARSLTIEQTSNPASIQNIVDENACLAPRTPVDVIFSIDSSWSMEQNDPANLRLIASKAFIDQLDSTIDRAAAVSWGGKLGYKSELVSDFEELKQNIDRINLTDANNEFSQQNTDYNIGVKEAINILDNNSKNSSKILIFLSDGEHNGFEDPPIPYEPNSLIDYATENNYKIYAIGLNISSGSDGEKLLRAMSEPTGGKYFPSPSPENLKEIFDSIFVQEVQHFEFQPADISLKVKGFGGTSERLSPVNVVFSIDGSGSMDENDPDDLRLDAAKIFMDKLDPAKDAAGIVSWSGELDLSAGLTSDFNSLKEKADSIERREGTNLNIGISSAIKMLDTGFTNEAMNPSKSIVFLTDGKGEYTKSGMPASPADLANLKGYKIFPIGLNVGGTDAESDLIDVASASGGQYFSAPTAENLEAVYEEIFERVIESTAPSNLTLIETFPDYVKINSSTFSVIPTDISKDGIGQTTIEWRNFSKTVGDTENKLSMGEEFAVRFKAGFNDNIIKHLNTLEGNGSSLNIGNESNFSFKAPLINEQQSVIRYVSPNGFATEEKVPPAFVNLQIETCENQKFTGFAKEFTESVKYNRYNSPSFPFSVDYPRDWEIEQTMDRVTFDSPQDHPYDKYIEGVDVYVFETNYQTLKELVDAIIEDDKLDVTGYNLTEVKSGALGGLPSKVLMYNYLDSVWGPTQTMESISLWGGKYYLVSYSAKPLQFNLKLPIVDHMISSMTINR
jgi:hypothetical protein